MGYYLLLPLATLFAEDVMGFVQMLVSLDPEYVGRAGMIGDRVHTLKNVHLIILFK